MLAPGGLLMRRYLKILILITGFSASYADSLRFRLTWFVPRGTYGVVSAVEGFDVNRDGVNELIYSSLWKPQYSGFEKGLTYGVNELIFSSLWNAPVDSAALLYYSCYPYDRYVLSDSILGFYSLPFFSTIGDADGDSLIDVVVKNWDHIINEWFVGIYEATDLYSFPKRLVWARFNLSNDIELGQYITDLDRDGKKEISFIEYCWPTVLENYTDNRYRLVFRDTLGVKNCVMAIGDFDVDGKMEFGVHPASDWNNVAVYENVSDNQYEIIWMYQDSSWLGIDDACGALPDLTHNGKPEMMLGLDGFLGHEIPGAAIYIFESTGNNQFQVIFKDSMEYPWPDKSAEKRSDFGDIDSDGEVELVWSAGRDWWVYKYINGEFVKVHSQYHGNNRCSRTTNLCVYDLNKNGYPEIVEVNGDRAKVWEIEGVRLHRPNGGEVLVPGTQFPITWEKFTPPGADSFTLFVSFDNGRNYQTITTIQQSNDTLYLWRVPDSLSDSCKIMIWAYGPPRAGEDKPRGTAWDFSDSTFVIRKTGITEDTRYLILDTGLKIIQNPARREIRLQITEDRSQKIGLKIYDVCGKMVKSFTGGSLPSIICLNPGIYFVRLEVNGKVVTKKIVVIE